MINLDLTLEKHMRTSSGRLSTRFLEEAMISSTNLKAGDDILLHLISESSSTVFSRVTC